MVAEPVFEAFDDARRKRIQLDRACEEREVKRHQAQQHDGQQRAENANQPPGELTLADAARAGA